MTSSTTRRLGFLDECAREQDQESTPACAVDQVLRDLLRNVLHRGDTMESRSGTPQSVSAQPAPPPSRETIKVGFVSISDPNNPDAVSGMPHACFTALAATGLDVVPIFVSNNAVGGRAGSSCNTIRATRGWLMLLRRIPRPRLGLRSRLEALIETFGSWSDYQRTLKQAAFLSRQAMSQIAREAPDVLLGVCISTALSHINLDIPVVYASDATARLVNTTYPVPARRSKAFKLACDHIERQALARVTRGFFSSPATLESAVGDYGFPLQRARRLPFGAHVRPDPDERVDPDPPSRKNLRIVVVAADSRRKRLDFCIDIVEVIKSRGWAVELIPIGAPTRRALRSKLVRSLGVLRLCNADHRARHKEAYRQSHCCLLPSVGEMFGIAPCEAAHFGRPSVVSDIGGLPFVVQHGRTGLVMPPTASAADYASAFEFLSSDEEAYLQMGRQGARAGPNAVHLGSLGPGHTRSDS